MLQTTSFSTMLFFLSLLLCGHLAQSKDNIEKNATDFEKPIRQSQYLCAGEQHYVHRRKEVVMESLRTLGMNYTPDSVPHIALLASGGGQRAAVGLMGSLSQMEKNGLLDYLLYLGGVSGSTWTMASLYSDPQWSSNMDRAVSRLSGDGVTLQEAHDWLSKQATEESFSLSDIWGVLTSAGIMKQIDLRCLSDEANRNASNPYPIYSAVEKHCFSDEHIKGKWFEVSPHEAGFTELDLFVNTSLLSSKFQEGELLEEKPEMDMVKLQGILGSALAHEDMIAEVLPPWLNVAGYVDTNAKEYLHIYNSLDKMISLTRIMVRDPTSLRDLDKLQKILIDKVYQNKSAFLESKTLEQKKCHFQQWGLELVEATETWTQNLEEGAFKTHVSILTKQVIPLIIKWEWGTNKNFLYQYPDSSIPTCLLTKETIQLVDAGRLINVPYPPFLGDKREIDLIIAPEYSAGNMFETLTLASDYAAKVKKPFPVIDNKIILEDRDWPKDCYVFDGKEKEPTIVYMPLFNRQNCKDANEFQAKMKEFSTFQGPFNREKLEFVLSVARTNMKNNREILLREIIKATLRRQNRREAK